MSNITDALRAQNGFISLGATAGEQIEQAEAALGVRFAKDYRDYVAAFGVASFEGHELTGVCAFQRLSVVSVTQQERQKSQDIPNDWYVIEQANIDDVVTWQDASGTIYQTIEGAVPQRVCDSLSAYLTMS